MIIPLQRPIPDNTQRSQQTDIHVPGGIRTRKRVAAEPCLTPRVHRDRHTQQLVQLIFVIVAANNVKYYCPIEIRFPYNSWPVKYVPHWCSRLACLH